MEKKECEGKGSQQNTQNYNPPKRFLKSNKSKNLEGNL
jgi:hypothetical protein